MRATKPAHDPMTIDLFETADEAILRSRIGAGEEWVERAVAAIELVASRGEPFTTTEVWKEMGRGDVAEPRAMGAAIREAVSRGKIRPSVCPCCEQQRTRAGDAENHGRRMSLWEAAT